MRVRADKTILLVALNAKYIHLSPVLPQLKACCGKNAPHITLLELTINHAEDFILSEIYKEQPAAVGFSCYIWNIAIIKRLLESLRKILPQTVIILGGPEAAYGGDALLDGLCDMIATGEGERSFAEIVRLVLNDRIDKKRSIPGIKYLDGGLVTENHAHTTDLATLPFAYEDYQPDGRIVYYESSRGCPFMCTYCLSGATAGIRYKPLDMIKRELLYLIDSGVKLIKFTDRTFNANKTHALTIWRFLTENHGSTRFHFEIAADLLDDETLHTLKNVEKGIFQFEIGVQTTNPETLAIIDRHSNIPRLFENVKTLRRYGNIPLHLDLIAGLPGEGYESFVRSFDAVYALKPDHLQLGFLKLLPGTRLRERAAELKITYREHPPYEVLYTDALSYAELLDIKRVEMLIGIVYNSGLHKAAVKYAACYGSPFTFYYELSLLYEKRGLHRRSAGRFEIVKLLYDFFARGTNDMALIKDILRFDIYMTDNVKTLPPWLAGGEDEDTGAKKRALLKDRGDAAGKRLRAEDFEYNVAQWLAADDMLRNEKNSYLFEYPRAAGEGVKVETL